MSTAQNVLTGKTSQTNSNARELFDTLVRSWGLPIKHRDDGELADISQAKRMAREEGLAERYGHEHAFLAAMLAGEGYERGQDPAVDSVLDHAERAATPDGERAAIDASIVQAATPIEVDPQIVDIQRSAAPVLDRITQEAQAGFTAQYNIINDRNAPVGYTSESDAIDLTDNSDGDFGLGTKTRDMTIYVDRVTLSDFTQRAEDSLNYMDVEETTLGQRTIVHALTKAYGIFYGDPDVGTSDGGVQDSNAFPGLAKIASDRDGDTDDGTNGHVIDKSGLSTSGDTPRLDDLKDETTDLVANTGAEYENLEIWVSPSFMDDLANEANVVTRLGGYDEDIDFGPRQIQVKGVPVVETRAVGRTAYPTGSYQGTGDSPAGNFDPADGDVFIGDTSTIRFRQLAPLSTVPLGRRGLADEAAMFEYGTLIDKSHGAHLKYLQAYPTA
jgi:hypothetical protein